MSDKPSKEAMEAARELECFCAMSCQCKPMIARALDAFAAERVAAEQNRIIGIAVVFIQPVQMREFVARVAGDDE